VVLPLLVYPPFPFFWAPRVPLIFFLFYFGSVEVGSIFESNSRMLPVVFAPKFLSRSFLFPSSYQPGFFSIFSASLSICILFLLGLFGLLIPSFVGCCSSGFHHSRIFRLLPVSGRELQTRTRCDDRCRRITSARSQGSTKSAGRCVSRSTHFAVRGL
jgi:hypothetical protein